MSIAAGKCLALKKQYKKFCTRPDLVKSDILARSCYIYNWPAWVKGIAFGHVLVRSSFKMKNMFNCFLASGLLLILVTGYTFVGSILVNSENRTEIIL